jgi:hypothetical protein
VITTAYHLVLAEWTKIRTIRSTLWSLLVMGVVAIGLASLSTALFGGRWAELSPGDRAHLVADPVGLVFQPAASFAQIAICVLGVLSIGSEYTTGLIQASALAVPRRVGFVASKTLVFGGLIFVFAELVAVPVLLIGRMILLPHVTIGLGDGAVIRATLGFGAYLAEVGLFAMAIGTMIRNLAGAITLALGIYVVLPNAATLVSGGLGDRIEAYLPGGEGAQAITSSAADPSAILTPLRGLTLMTAWALVLLCAATVLLRVRDIPEVGAAV